MNTREMVAAAAEWLDVEKPGWESLIDVGRLDLIDGCACIIGQTFGQGQFVSVVDRVPRAFTTAFLGIGPNPEDHKGAGFRLVPVLEEFWVDEIKARFNR